MKQFCSFLLKFNKTEIFLAVISLVFYTFFAYNLDRVEYIKLITIYASLFVLFYIHLKYFELNYSKLAIMTFLFRSVFLFAIPNLSQDFYRFIWDGRMLLQGFNPYLYTVQSFIETGNLPIDNAEELYHGMGLLNASHFTNYPPINQLCFVIANLFPGNSILSSVIGLRLIVIAADFGVLYFGSKLLNNLNLNRYNIFWYLLNPFIIIELTGNLHFEGVMIFFLVWSLFLLQKGKWQWSAVVLALSISTKLIPLIFLPLFFKWFTRPVGVSDFKPETSFWAGFKRLVMFYGIVVITIVLLFAPFLSAQFISNYSQTVGLWFQKFEFNASLYYLARSIGYLFRGYNEIAIIGKITPIIVVAFVLFFTFFKKIKSIQQLILFMLLVLSFYYFTATTVHPWYVATLLILSVFTKYRFPLVWSFAIVLSYLAYIQIGNANKSENLFVIAIEYLIVYGMLFWDIYKNKTKLA